MNVNKLSKWLASQTEFEARMHLSWRPKDPSLRKMLDKIDAEIERKFGRKVYESLK
jgi:hypothetical protein